MRNSIILSTGRYLPQSVVSNDHLTHFPKNSLKLISEKTGVLSRRHAREDECTSDLAIKAARNCLDRIGFPLEEVEGIIVSTSSPDRIQPPTATRVQHQLGAQRAFAFDINSVCSGSTYGMCVADSLIKSGRFQNILFIAAEMYSKILNKKDFSTYPFFGDGSGAVLLGAGNGSEKGVLHSCLKTDGSRCDTICVPAGGTMMPFEKMADPRSAFFRMSGKAVFDFAIDQGSKIIFQLTKEAGVSIQDVKCFISHQANINIIHKIAENIGVSPDKFFVNLDRYGNTASASVLIALDEVISGGLVTSGDLIVTVAFGGGLSWGANLIRI